MALFEKIQLEDVPKKGTVSHWILKIENENDLLKYHKLDAEANIRSFMSMERRDDKLAFDHLGCLPARDIALNIQIKLAVDALQEGEKLYPLIEVAKITDRKYLTMLSHIKNTGAIQINPSGGFCDYKSYIKIWNGKVLESIVKDDFGFPIEDEVINSKTIILENSNAEITGGYIKYYIDNFLIKDAEPYSAIYNLKEIDRNYVFKCLKNAENIIIPTEAKDKDQLDGFMKLFLSLPKKNIYIKCCSETKQKIQSHKMFSENKKIHNINFSIWR